MREPCTASASANGCFFDMALCQSGIENKHFKKRPSPLLALFSFFNRFLSLCFILRLYRSSHRSSHRVQNLGPFLCLPLQSVLVILLPPPGLLPNLVRSLRSSSLYRLDTERLPLPLHSDPYLVLRLHLPRSPRPLSSRGSRVCCLRPPHRLGLGQVQLEDACYYDRARSHDHRWHPARAFKHLLSPVPAQPRLTCLIGSRLLSELILL
jgi:hypothetical protein